MQNKNSNIYEQLAELQTLIKKEIVLKELCK